MTVEGISTHSLALMCHAVSDAVVVMDDAGRIALLNPAAEEVFGVRAADVVGRPGADIPALAPLQEVWNGSAPADGAPPVQRVWLPSGSVYQARVLDVPGLGRAAFLKPGFLEDASHGQLALQMGTIIHTLKTPIASAKMALDLVLALEGQPDKQADFTRRAQHSLDHMLSIVHEVIDMTWLEAGATLEWTQTDLDELAAHAVEQLESDRAWRGVTVDVARAPGGCVVWGDERRLMGAITNLVSNAIKYSRPGGTVRVRTATDGRTASLTVSDDGIGIPPEHIGRIFDWFYRVTVPETRRIEGSGLGLAIVKAIVERHGGEVTVESEPGRGSTFRFTVPVERKA